MTTAHGLRPTRPTIEAGFLGLRRIDAGSRPSKPCFQRAYGLHLGFVVITPALILYLALTVVFAAWIVAHAALVLGVIRRSGLRRAWAALPPVTPVVAWRAGARVGPVVWSVLLVGYAVLLIAAHA